MDKDLLNYLYIIQHTHTTTTTTTTPDVYFQERIVSSFYLEVFSNLFHLIAHSGLSEVSGIRVTTLHL